MGVSKHIVITSAETGDIVNIAIDPSETIENLKALLEVETNIPLVEQILVFNNMQLANNKRIDEYNIQESDLLVVHRSLPIHPTPSQQQQQQQQQAGGGAMQQMTPQMLIDQIKNNPDLLQKVLTDNPPLGEAVLAGDVAKIEGFLENQKRAKRLQQDQQERRLKYARILAEDPFNVEAQKAIEEEIRQDNVDENLDSAMEHTPESFGDVIMLYVDCVANKVPLKAFVDTGAQMTIMSVQCAERCGIMRLVDRRYSGIAKGVGTAKVLGRVHMAPIQIGQSFFPCSFTILEQQDMEFILGLDMLRRHRCIIDLAEGTLKIGDEKVPFLSEGEIPRKLFNSADDSHAKAHHTPTDAISSATTSSTSTSSTSSTPTTPPQQPQTTAKIPAQQPTTAASTPSPQAIQQLVELGATPQEAAALLARYRGNVDLAASHLFGGGF